MPKNNNSAHPYWAYGITIDSEVRLDDLLSAELTSKGDVRISYRQITESIIGQHLENFELIESPGRRLRVSENAMYVAWDRVGKFLVHSGSEVLVEPEIAVPDTELQPFITGPVLSVLLHQRGLFVLHSSAVTIGGAAVVFLGAKGYGKSTLAAHLQVRGHQLISDDLVPVSFAGDHAVTFPGYPRIKLNEDSIVAVGERPERFPLIHRFVEKRSFKHTEEFSKKSFEMLAVYILAESDGIAIETLSPSDAFIELTKHSFLKNLMNAMNGTREHFQQCEKLVQSVPVFKLGRPHDFAVMEEVCMKIEDHIQKLVSE